MTPGPEFPPALDRRLAPAVRERLRDWRDAHRVAGFAAVAERVWRATPVERALARRAPAPLLPLAASKFGGRLHRDPGSDPPGARPLFQISFAELRPRSDALPGQGLLVAWEPAAPGPDAPPLVFRWHAALPEDSATVGAVREDVLEARLRFRPRWFLPVPGDADLAEIFREDVPQRRRGPLGHRIRRWARHFDGRRDDGTLELLPAVTPVPDADPEETPLLRLRREPAAGWRSPVPVLATLSAEALARGRLDTLAARRQGGVADPAPADRSGAP